MSNLRHIAVYVEEPDRGRFAWVLAERHGAHWRELGKADASVATYKRAMADGLLALQSMVEDLDIGPRDETPEEQAKASESHSRSEKRDETTTTAASAKPYFGFGPAR